MRKQLQSLSLFDADIERAMAQAKELKEEKEKYSRRCPRCGNMVDMRKRDDIRFHNGQLTTRSFSADHRMP
jgi:ribosomal protein S27AE